MKKKVLFIIGTRPEAIKLAPVAAAMQQEPEHFAIEICYTGQHRELVTQVIDFFGLPGGRRLPSTSGLTLDQKAGTLLSALHPVIQAVGPDLVIVQGDTLSAFSGALSAFHHQVAIAHVEAGLRTGNSRDPYPEEMYRKLIGQLADWHLAPTVQAAENLLREGVPAERITVCGNTVVDALLWGLNILEGRRFSMIGPLEEWRFEMAGRKKILVTIHRRENQGESLISICEAMEQLARRDDIFLLWPVHPNPEIDGPVRRKLGGIKNVALLPPLAYESFLWLVKESHLIITDSGGLQEEAPVLGKPLVVVRNVTERMEGVNAGSAILAGTDKGSIIRSVEQLLQDQQLYQHMARQRFPYGEGGAAECIIRQLKDI